MKQQKGVKNNYHSAFLRKVSVIGIVAILAMCSFVFLGQNEDSEAAVTASGSCGINTTWELVDGTLTISGIGPIADYTALECPWILYRSEIRSLVINDGVTSIGNYAFYRCSSLSSVSIPLSVLSIHNFSFEDCISLISITLPVTTTSIGNCVFRGCTSLISILIPSNVSTIGTGVFVNCSSLTSIMVSNDNDYYSSEDGVLFNKTKTTLIRYPMGKIGASYSIPSSVSTIGTSAFASCDSLVSISIPGSVNTIEGGAFNGCSSLSSITIPSGVTSVGGSVFRDCSSLSSITLLNNMTSIKEMMFYGCTSLTSFTIPGPVTTIESGAFYGCSSLSSITISGNVIIIDSRAFEGCTSLSSVNLPEILQILGEEVFARCTSLTSITISDYNSRFCTDDGVLFNKSKSKLIQYPAGKTATAYSIPYSVTTIERSAFEGSSNLVSIDIPDNVTTIKSSAFKNCTSLSSIVIPDDVTVIDYWVFSGCSSLISVSLHDNITALEGSAFQDCTSITSFNIPSGITSISNSAFDGCSSLAMFTVSNDNTHYSSVNGVLFSKDLKQLIKYPVGKIGSSYSIPNGTTDIGYRAFSDCSSLSSITIPNTVTSTGNLCFSGCTALTEITIPKNLTSLGLSAFKRCNSLTRITVSEENTVYCSVDGVLFNKEKTMLIGYPYGKTSYVIPESVTTIDRYVFSECTNLESITFPDNLEYLGTYAFEGTTFYDTDGITPLTTAAYNLKSCVFRGSNGILVKQVLYTISFESNGGSQVVSQRVVEGDEANEPITPLKTGYQFVKWYSNVELTEEYDFSTPVSGNLTLYAKWNPINYVVHYDSNDGAGSMGDQMFTYDFAQTLNANTFTREGYTFGGWNTLADGTGISYSDCQLVNNMTSSPDATVTIYAQWNLVVTRDESGNYLVTVKKTARFVSDLISEIKNDAETNNGITMTVNFGDKIIIFDNESLKSLKVEDANLTFEEITVPPALRDKIGNHPVFEISFGNNYTFGSGRVTIIVPYNLEDDEDPDNLVIYYIKDDQIKDTIECTYENGKVTISTDHLSIYAISYEVPSNGLNVITIVGIVVAILGVATVTAFIVLRRR